MSSHAIGSVPLTTAAPGTTAAPASTRAPMLSSTSTTPRPTTFNRTPVDAAASEFDQLGAAVRAAAVPAAAVAQPGDSFQQQKTALLAKIGPSLDVVDAATSAQVEQLFQQADARGSFRASEVARMVVQVEGAAAGLPPSYLQAASRAQDLAAEIEQDIDDALVQINAFIESGGNADAVMPLLELVNQVMESLEQLQVDLRANYDLARKDPGAAETKLRAALTE